MNSPVAIDVTERRSVPIDGVIAEEVPSSFWKASDCVILRSPGDSAWMLTAGDSVGASRILTANRDVRLIITPKLDDADIFFLADYAFGQRHQPLRMLDFDEPTLAAIRRDPTACLLLWHVSTIGRFAARWLRRDYRTIDQVVRGKVKGRVLLHRYLTEHLALGHATDVPCRSIEQTQDTPNNRVLKAALRRVVQLSRALQVPAAGRAVRQQVAAVLPRFALVADIDVNSGVLRATSTRGPQRHYFAVLRSARHLLDGQFVSTDAGSLSAQSFVWRMPILFQEAVRGIVESTPGIKLDESAPPSAAIYNAAKRRLRTSKVDPDIVLRIPGGHTILLDTKYKNVLTGHVADTEALVLTTRERISVSRSDIYQAVAYRRQDRWVDGTKTSGLLFPVSLPAGVALPQPMQVRGFGQPIPLLFIDIGPSALDNLQAFRASLIALHAVGEGLPD